MNPPIVSRTITVFSILILLFLFGCNGEEPEPPLGLNQQPSPNCGNGEVDPDEVCDGDNLNGETCSSLGFGDGELACHSSCQAFDVSLCGAPETCGNGEIDGPEVCDGDNLASATCESLGYGPGTLSCLPNCGAFDTSQCGGTATCGNGEIDGLEVCDGENLAGKTCEDFGYQSGSLACASNCRSFDESQCVREIECSPDCPSGYQCDLPTGTCIDGDPTALVLNVLTHRVQGEIRQNGAPPSYQYSDNDECVFAHFVEKSDGYTFTIGVSCNNQGDPFAFDSEVYPGVYDVYASGRWGSLPGQHFLAIEDLTINANTSNLILDVQTLSAGGEIQKNGAPPSYQYSDNDECVFARFVETSRGYTFTIGAPCNNQGEPFTFEGDIYPGVYDVYAYGRWGSLPGQHFKALQNLQITADRSDIVLNVATHQVSGEIQRNGAPPSYQYNDNDECVFARFVETSTGYTFTIGAPCNNQGDPFTFDSEVYPGVYDVYASGRWGALPSEPFPALRAVQIAGPEANLILDVITRTVSGEIQKNSAPPSYQYNDSDECVFARFTDEEQDFSFTIGAPCNNQGLPFTFEGLLYPGVYQISAYGRWGSLPNQPYIITERLRID